MKPSSLVPLLAKSFRSGMKLLLVSAPGVGKTALVKLAAAMAEADLVVMHPAVSDPTDFKGMPAILETGKGGKSAEFLPFGNLRKLVEAKSLTVCFIDDIGQAPHSVQAALMQLIHGGEIDGQKISPHVVFVGATNDTSHMAGVNTILEPVKSRWDSILTVEPDTDDWVKWALGDGKMPPELVAFVRFKPATLATPFKPSRDLTNSPSPRTLEAAGRWIRNGIDATEVLVGAVGAGCAGEIAAFLKIYRSMPDLDSILAHPESAPLPGQGEASLALSLCAALAYRATPDNFAAVIAYLRRLPKEYEVMAVRDATARERKLYDTPAYTAWAADNIEALA